MITIKTTKKALQEKIKEQKEVCAQYRLGCIYLAFDLEATRRERDGARAQVVLLREELAEMRDKLGEIE